jgi:hypothetical protein
MLNLSKNNWVVIKWILHYLKDTIDTASCYCGQNIDFVGYADVDFGSDYDRIKYTTNISN